VLFITVRAGTACRRLYVSKKALVICQ